MAMKKTIYIVDDSKVILKKTSALFEDFKVRSFNSPKRALGKIIASPPHIVITDVTMNGMSGIELTKEIRKNEKTKDVPVIVMSALDGDEILKEAYEAGANEYINKANASDTKLKLRVQNILDLSDLIKNHASLAKRNEDLLKILTHDLSSPLMAIDGFAYFLQNESLTEKGHGFVTKIQNVATNSVEILEQVKDMLKSEEYSPVLKPVQVKKLLEDLVMKFEDRFESKKINFTAKIPEDNLYILCDRATVLNNIFSNVLSNAFKFTAEGGKVSVVYEVKKNHVYFYFVDNGVGIPEDLLDGIFEKGADASRAGTNHEKGTGFGLGIIKTFMLKNNGNISIRSQDIESSPDYHYTEFCLSFEKATEEQIQSKDVTQEISLKDF
jgi:two-component system sensor histidine kinase/response regulator